MRKDRDLNGDLNRLPMASSAGVLACAFRRRLGAGKKRNKLPRTEIGLRDAAPTRRRGRLRYVDT